MVHMDVVAQWEMQQDFFTRMFSETRVFTDACGFRTRLFTFWKPTTEQFGTSVESTTNRECVFWFRVERCRECSFELRQCPDLSVDAVVSGTSKTKSTGSAFQVWRSEPSAVRTIHARLSWCRSCVKG